MQDLVCMDGVAVFSGKLLCHEVIKAINADQSIHSVEIYGDCTLIRNLFVFKFGSHVKKILFHSLATLEQFSKSHFNIDNIEIDFAWNVCESTDPDMCEEAVTENVRAILIMLWMEEPLWTARIRTFMELDGFPDVKRYKTGIVDDATLDVVTMLASFYACGH